MRFKLSKYLLNNYKDNSKHPSHNGRGKRNTTQSPGREHCPRRCSDHVTTTPDHHTRPPHQSTNTPHRTPHSSPHTAVLVHWQQLTLWSGFYWPHPDRRVASAVPVEVPPEHSPGGGERERETKNTARNTNVNTPDLVWSRKLSRVQPG